MRFVLPSLLLVAVVCMDNIGGQTSGRPWTGTTWTDTTCTATSMETSTYHDSNATEAPATQNPGPGPNSLPPLPPLPPFEYAMVIVPLFLLLGLVGNILTIIVINSRNFQHMSSSLILTVLSISDTLLIIMLPFNKKFFLEMLPADPRSLSLASCKVFFWFWRTAKMTSSWFIVLISVERFVAVWFPLKAQVVNSKKNIAACIIAIYATIGGFNAGWGAIADVLIGSCRPNVPYAPSFEESAKGMIVAGTLLYSIIPACLVLILNTLILGQLLIQKRRRRYMSDTPTNDHLSKTTAMLLTVSIAFIALVVPISIAHCFTLFRLNESIFSSDNPTVALFREVAQTLEQLNYSINFFLYVLSSGRFRKQVVQLFCRSRVDGIHSRKAPVKSSLKRKSCSSKTTDTSSNPDGKGSEPGILSQISEPGIQSQDSEPGIQSQNSEPCILSQNSEPGIQSQYSEPGIQSQISQPGIQSQNLEPGIQSENSEPGIQSQDSEPGIQSLEPRG